MRLRHLAAMISTVNDYSHLKWPLTLLSVLITVLALTLLLSFCSNAWFSFQTIYIQNQSTIFNQGIEYSHIVNYGSFGLWTICISYNNNPNVQCETWTRQSRPENFSVILILVSCALFLSNLTIFPAWASTILILYNRNNRYIRHIVAFTWVLFILAISFTAILISAMLLTGLTRYYSPGQFFLDGKSLSFDSDTGVYCILVATILAISCLLLVIIILIWKKLIEMKLAEAERELFRQLTDDNYQPGWHKIIMIPRNNSANDDNFGEPPPYENYRERTNS